MVQKYADKSRRALGSGLILATLLMVVLAVWTAAIQQQLSDWVASSLYQVRIAAGGLALKSLIEILT